MALTRLIPRFSNRVTNRKITPDLLRPPRRSGFLQIKNASLSKRAQMQISSGCPTLVPREIRHKQRSENFLDSRPKLVCLRAIHAYMAQRRGCASGYRRCWIVVSIARFNPSFWCVGCTLGSITFGFRQHTLWRRSLMGFSRGLAKKYRKEHDPVHGLCSGGVRCVASAPVSPGSAGGLHDTVGGFTPCSTTVQ